jgi:hypothetical protein
LRLAVKVEQTRALGENKHMPRITVKKKEKKKKAAGYGYVSHSF